MDSHTSRFRQVALLLLLYAILKNDKNEINYNYAMFDAGWHVRFRILYTFL